MQLNSLDIGEGFVLKVSPANFEHKPAPKAEGPVPAVGGSMLSTVAVGKVDISSTTESRAERKMKLPEECESHLFPVTLICNVYVEDDLKSSDENFLSDLEVIILFSLCLVVSV